MTWFLMNKEGTAERETGKASTNTKQNRNVKCYKNQQRPWKSPTKANEQQARTLSFNLTMPFLPLQTVKKGDPTLDALSISFRLNPKNKIIHHCDKNTPVCQDAGGSLWMKRNDFEFWMRGISDRLQVMSINEEIKLFSKHFWDEWFRNAVA